MWGFESNLNHDGVYVHFLDRYLYFHGYWGKLFLLYIEVFII